MVRSRNYRTDEVKKNKLAKEQEEKGNRGERSGNKRALLTIGSDQRGRNKARLADLTTGKSADGVKPAKTPNPERSKRAVLVSH